MAQEKANAAQKLAEEQVKKTGEALSQTKSDAENLAAGTGIQNI